MKSKFKKDEMNEELDNVESNDPGAPVEDVMEMLENLDPNEPPKEVSANNKDELFIFNEAIESYIKSRIDRITDEKIQELLIPVVQKEFTEKIAPAIEANINDRIDSKVKEKVKEILAEIFSKNQ